MSEARLAILARLQGAQRTAMLPEVAPPPPRVEPALGPEECLERFRQELGLLGVDVYLERSEAEVRARVKTLLEGRPVLSWDADCLPYELGAVLGDAVFGGSPREEQARAEVGLTGCEAALAETGTLALLSGKGRSRAVSLLPPVHLAVVRRDQLCFSMGQFFRRHADRMAEVASCTFITGPSRTADIELTLTLGVHGPGKVVVVIGP